MAGNCRSYHIQNSLSLSLSHPAPLLSANVITSLDVNKLDAVTAVTTVCEHRDGRAVYTRMK